MGYRTLPEFTRPTRPENGSEGSPDSTEVMEKWYRPKLTTGSRESWSVASRMKVEKAFTFQKTDSGSWRCDTKSLQPVDFGVAVGGP